MSQRSSNQRWLRDALPTLLTRELLRQGRAPAPSPCPDANALTAFMERHLEGADPSGIADHLNHCDDCRMTVMLAVRAGLAPQATSGARGTLLAPAPAPSRFLPWATVSGVAAGLLAAFLLFWQQPVPPRLQQAQLSVPAGVAALPAVPSRRVMQRGHALAPVPLEQSTAGPAAPILTASLPPARVPLPTATTIASVVHPTPLRQGFATLSRPSLRAIQGVDVEATSLNSGGPSQAPSGTTSLAANVPAPAQPFQPSVAMASSFLGSSVTPASSAAPVAAPHPSLLSSTRNSNDGNSVMRTVEDGLGFSKFLAHGSPTTTWRISSTGELERSAGKGLWLRVPMQAGSRLVSLTVSGMHLWVGSQDGVLYHSPDGGQSWHPIRLDADGHSMQDAIVGIHFRDQREGELMTRSGVRWFTLDGGQFWKPVISAPVLTATPTAARH